MSCEADFVQQFEFEPALLYQLVEERPDCQLLTIDGRPVIVASPGSVKRPKLSWKVRLLRWLAKG